MGRLDFSGLGVGVFEGVLSRDELHPDILLYYKQIEKILEKNNSSIFLEFEKRIQNEEPKFIFLWLDDLLQQNLIPKDVDGPLTNLYGAIR